MSGICGFFSTRDLEDPAGRLDRMIVSLGGEPDGSRAAFRGGRVALGAAGPRAGDVGVATEGSGAEQTAVVVYGRLYGLNGDAAPTTAAAAAAAILEGYRERGIEILAALRGEYCLALWDGRAETLHVATDPFRTHSILYTDVPSGVSFSSRLRSLREAGEVDLGGIDPRGVVDVIASSYIPTPRTIYRNVRKLPLAHRLTVRGRETSVVPYWDVDFRSPSREPFAVLADRVRGALQDAVAVRLRVDDAEGRAVGTFLSGGIDSSTVTGLVGRLHGGEVACFSIGFAESGYDELSYARLSAAALGATYHERLVTAADVGVLLPSLLDAFDEPFANASAVPTYYCARFARENGMDVLYAGDGGDELFAGNQRYASRRIFDHYETVPGWIRRGLLEPAVFTAAARTPFSLFARAKRYIDRANAPRFVRMTAFDLLRVHPAGDIFRDDVLASLGPAFVPYDDGRRCYESAPADTPLDRELYLDLKMAIGDNDMLKVTRMCEAAGVDVRFPFLDRAVAEAAAQVPAALKMRGGRLRWFFKEAYADLLPAAVRAKKKHGFGLPIAVWLRTDPALRTMSRDLILGPGSRVSEYLKRTALEDLVRRHDADTTAFYGTILWNVLILELFLRSERATGA